MLKTGRYLRTDLTRLPRICCCSCHDDQGVFTFPTDKVPLSPEIMSLIQGILNTDVRKNDEFCIKNEGICIKNDESCITNDELCTKDDEFCSWASGLQ